VNASSDVTVLCIGLDDAALVIPAAIFSPASSPNTALNNPSIPGALPSARFPSGFRGSNADLDVYRSRHVPQISSRVAGRAMPPSASRTARAAAMASSSAADAFAPRPGRLDRREISSASASAMDEEEDVVVATSSSFALSSSLAIVVERRRVR